MFKVECFAFAAVLTLLMFGAVEPKRGNLFVASMVFWAAGIICLAIEEKKK